MECLFNVECWKLSIEEESHSTPNIPQYNLVLHQLAIAALLDLLVAESVRLIDLVVGVAALEVEHLAIALEGKDVGADTVEDPSVVADDDSTSGKSLKTFLKGPESINVDVVGRLVEEEHIAFLL